MMIRFRFTSVFLMLLNMILLVPLSARAAVELTFWHGMDSNLNTELMRLVNRFNESQTTYHVEPIYKGSYEQTLSAGIAAYRTGNAPDILQVYDVGTTNMIHSGAIVPVFELFKQVGIENDEKAFLPAVALFYSDSQTGHLISQPFNSSTPVLYYNKDAFVKAGLDPDKPPRTWNELAYDAARLHQSGMACGYTNAGQQGWILLEAFSVWNGLPIATKNNGFDGVDVHLLINGPLQVAHITQLAEMMKNKAFSYFGRNDEATARFYNGDCGILTTSSGGLRKIQNYAKFHYGVGMLPYSEEANGAPQNTFIGGASLWVMKGKAASHYQGIAEFLHFLTLPENAAEWHQMTGYLPVTQAAYKLTIERGFYARYPGSDVAMKQLTNKPPLPYTRGFRLGNMPQIRTIMDEELEKVWAEQETPQQALDNVVSRGDLLLQHFAQSVSRHS
ncbi:sn-glycerol-3-phosphate ABC transporter substrate-binding protein UgpB [Pectobacterium sp. B2J-2]|uniref:sn-glycerol-3-phosphate ABC transporter substrate-binding protein UgpB n=1 Tax=Pectobacterium sp. B2J-2 TaxID=3385372 RepID=UPI0038FC1B54